MSAGCHRLMDIFLDERVAHQRLFSPKQRFLMDVESTGIISCTCKYRKDVIKECMVCFEWLYSEK